MNRRKFLKQTGAGVGTLALLPISRGLQVNGHRRGPGDWSGGAPYLRNTKTSKRVIVLGLDGMDPNLLRRFVAEGGMPNFQRLIQSGYFGDLQTTLPPQSPVAWASFITGTDPGGHGIFDFLHRDPKSFTPHLSTSRAFSGEKKITLGDWCFPLAGGHIDLLRRGTPYWSVLEKYQIPSFVLQIPSNFPVVPSDSFAISGMGTPDLLGTYGTFTLISEDRSRADKLEGGRFVPLQMVDHAARAILTGPQNDFRADRRPTEVELRIHRDPTADVIRLAVDDHELILQRGEWSEWIPLRFELVPLFASASGMVRVYVKQVHPKLELYVSPINIDPMNPSLPIGSPEGYPREIAQAVGRFYTQGFPADTKALSRGALSDEEYFMQAQIVLEENRRVFEYTLKNFEDGCFFFYFSNLDQNSHMLWRCMDPSHPLHDPNADPKVKGALRWFYHQMDEVLGQALGRVDSATTLLVLSDHGFAPFGREFHLSSWLAEQGYTVFQSPRRKSKVDFFPNVDWSRTTAYALGLNGIYVNRRGRERQGWVEKEQGDRIKAEIIQKLATVRDPLTQQPVVRAAYDSAQVYSGPFTDVAPDVLVGYHRGFRISDESAFGKFPEEVIGNRTDKWAADHCIDPSVVPGVLLSNRGCTAASPGIWDLAPSILNLFGLKPPSSMTGSSVLEI